MDPLISWYIMSLKHVLFCLSYSLFEGKGQKTPVYKIYHVLFCPRNHRRQTAATTSAAWRTNGETTTPHLPSAKQPCPRHIFLFSFSLFLFCFCPDFHSHLTSVARKWDCKGGKYFRTHKQLFVEIASIFCRWNVTMGKWWQFLLMQWIQLNKEKIPLFKIVETW